MSLAGDLSHHAEGAGRRYAALIDGWRHFYTQATVGDHAGTAKALNRLREQAYAAARTFLDAERVIAKDVSTQIALQARESALSVVSAASTADDASERIHELLAASLSDLHAEIVMQIERDILFLAKSARHAALEVEMAAQVQGIPVAAAKVRMRVYGQPELVFSIRDRAGRRWPSEKFVRTVWRQHLLDAYNETVLATLADHGIDQARVVAPGANHDGLRVTLLHSSGLPTYREIRDALFHPNSEAFLAPIED